MSVIDDTLTDLLVMKDAVCVQLILAFFVMNAKHGYKMYRCIDHGI